MSEAPFVSLGDHLLQEEAQADPYPTWRMLRDDYPVLQDPATGSWVTTRFEDVYNILRDHERFASGVATAAAFDEEIQPQSILVRDVPPRHTFLRSVVNPGFTPRAIKQIESETHRICADVLDQMEQEESAEVFTQLAIPVPMRVIAHKLGIPQADIHLHRHWSDASLPWFSGTEDDRRRAVRELKEYFRAVADQRREEPSDDLISLLVAAHEEYEAEFPDEDILRMCYLLLFAGNETTTNLITNMLNVLVDRPDLWEQLRADRSLVEKAVEETLRYDCPVPSIARRATEEVKIDGVTIPENARIVTVLAAANRDEREFPDSETFRLDRDLNRHVAFAVGIHHCLGSPLSRLEGLVLLNEMLDRYKALERSGEIRVFEAGVAPVNSIRGINPLPIRFIRD